MLKFVSDALAIFGMPDTTNIEEGLFYLKKYKKKSIQRQLVDRFRLTEGYRKAFGELMAGNGDNKDLLYARMVLGFCPEEYDLLHFEEKRTHERLAYLSEFYQKQALRRAKNRLLPLVKVPEMETEEEEGPVCITAAVFLKGEKLRLLAPYLTVRKDDAELFAALSPESGDLCGKWISRQGREEAAPSIPAVKWEEVKGKFRQLAKSLPALPMMIWRLALTADGEPKLADCSLDLPLQPWQFSSGIPIRRAFRDMVQASGYLPEDMIPAKADAFALPEVARFSPEETFLNRLRLTEEYRETFGQRFLEETPDCLELLEAKAAMAFFGASSGDSEADSRLLGDLLYSRFVLGFQYREYFLYGLAEKTILQRLSFLPAGTVGRYHMVVNRGNQSRHFFSDPFEAWKLQRTHFERDTVFVRGEKDRERFLDFCAMHPEFTMRRAGREWISHLVCNTEKTAPEVLFEECLKKAPVLCEARVTVHAKLRQHLGQRRVFVRVYTYRRNPDVRAGVLYPVLTFNHRKMRWRAALDPETGRIIAPAVNDSGDRLEVFPRSHKALVGFAVPGWEGLLEKAADCADLSPDISLLGWDLLPAEDGRCTLLSSVYRGPIGQWQLSAGRGIVDEMTDAMDWQMRLDSRNSTWDTDEYAVYEDEANTPVDKKRFFLNGLPACKAEKHLLHQIRLSEDYRTAPAGEAVSEVDFRRPLLSMAEALALAEKEIPGFEGGGQAHDLMTLPPVEAGSDEALLTDCVRVSEAFLKILGRTCLRCEAALGLVAEAEKAVEVLGKVTENDPEAYRKLLADVLVMGEVIGFLPWEFFHQDMAGRSMSERLSYLPDVSLRMNYYFPVLLENVYETRRLADKYRTFKALKPYYKREVMEIVFGGSDRNREAFLQMVLKYHRLIFKSNGYGGGRGIQIVSCHDRAEAEACYERLVRLAPGVCEECIVSDEALARFHPQSVNTVRLFTCRSDAGVKIIYPWLKAGSGGAVVDNAMAGGLMAAIDPETGIVFTDGGSEFVYARACSDTGVPFKGFQIPDWEALCDMVCACAARFPGISLIGWDMALSADRGWLVIEANSIGAVNLIQLSLKEGILRPLAEALEWKERLLGKRNLLRDEAVTRPDAQTFPVLLPEAEAGLKPVFTDEELYLLDFFRLQDRYRDLYGAAYRKRFAGTPSMAVYERILNSDKMARLPFLMPKEELFDDLIFSRMLMGFSLEEYFAFDLAARPVEARLSFISAFNLKTNLLPAVNGDLKTAGAACEQARRRGLFKSCDPGDYGRCRIRVFTVCKNGKVTLLAPLHLLDPEGTFGAAVDPVSGSHLGWGVNACGEVMTTDPISGERLMAASVSDWAGLCLLVSESAKKLAEIPLICWNLCLKEGEGWRICRASPEGEMLLYQASSGKGLLYDFAEAVFWHPTPGADLPVSAALREALPGAADTSLLECGLFRLRPVPEKSVHWRIMDRIRKTDAFQQVRLAGKQRRHVNHDS